MNHKKLKGGLTISRPQGSHGPPYIELSINDDLSGSQFVTVRVSLAEFAEALTGPGHVECEFDFRPDLVGLRRETKDEWIAGDPLPYAREGLPRENLAAPRLAPFEVDGWKGRVDDLFNHYRRNREGARVTFVRYVKPEAGK